MKIEIKENEKKEIDWSNPQLVISKCQMRMVVLADGVNCDDGLFNGYVMGKAAYRSMSFVRNWHMDDFELFTGQVILQNDNV